MLLFLVCALRVVRIPKVIFFSWVLILVLNTGIVGEFLSCCNLFLNKDDDFYDG